MKIEVRGEGHHIKIPIPGWLLYSRLGIRLSLRSFRSGMSFLGDISDKDVEHLLREIGRYRKKHGSWELVHVETADGELVSIIV